MKNSDRKDKKYRIVPRGTRVIIRRHEGMTVKSWGTSGLVIPDEFQEKKMRFEGIVEAVGKLCVETEVGQHVVYGKYADNHIPGCDDANLVMIDEIDILGDKEEIKEA